MSLTLNNVFQSAGRAQEDQAATTKVSINDTGEVRSTGGLGWFARNFPSSSQKSANRATLDKFQTAITQSPAYRSVARNNDGIASFFQRKQAEGTPLTAADVKAVKGMLEQSYEERARDTFSQQNVWETADQGLFIHFCKNADLPLVTTDDAKAALKAFAASGHDNTLAYSVLERLGVPPKDRPLAIKVLQGSSAWHTALDDAFQRVVNRPKGEVLQKLQNALTLWNDTLTTILQDQTIREYTAQNPAAAENLLKGMGELVHNGNLSSADAADFCKTCIAEGLSIDSPAGKRTAITRFIKNRLAPSILQKAAGNTFPAALGLALAKRPQFNRMLDEALHKSFPPPAIPTVEELTPFMNSVTTAFWTSQKEHMEKLFAVTKNLETLPLNVQAQLSTLTDERICELLGTLLGADALMDHLLVPEHKTDAAYLTLLTEFQALLAPHSPEVGTQILTLLLAARGGDGNTLGTLLTTLNTRTKELAPSLHALSKELPEQAANEPPQITLTRNNLAAIQTLTQNLARAVHAATTPAQHAQSKVDNDVNQFVNTLFTVPADVELQPGAALAPAVANWGQSMGFVTGAAAYKENVDSYTREMNLLFNPQDGKFTPTDYSRSVFQACADELGLQNFNVNMVPHSSIYLELEARISGNTSKILTEAEVKAIAKDVFLQYMAGVKTSLDSIASEAQVANPNDPAAFPMTPAEKQYLAKHLPYHDIRDAASIRTAVLTARAMKDALGVLASARSTPEERYLALRQMAAAYGENISAVPGGQAERDISQILDLALALAVSAQGFDEAQKTALYTFLTSEECNTFRNYIATMHAQVQDGTTPAAERERTLLRDSMRSLDNLRTTLAHDLGIPTGPVFMPLAPPIELTTVPSYILEHSLPGALKTPQLRALTILNTITPTLVEAERRALEPLLVLAGRGIRSSFDSDTSMRFLAAHARRILDAIRANPGRPLTLNALWRLIFEERPSWFMNEGNFADRMYDKAMTKLYSYAKIVKPEIGSFVQMQEPLRAALSQGVPLTIMRQGYRRNGTISMAQCQFVKLVMRPMPNTNAANDYGLADIWGKKKVPLRGTPPRLNIEVNGTSHGYQQNPEFAEPNNAHADQLKDIMKQCKRLCRDNAEQLKQVIHCLSPDAVEPVQNLSKVLNNAVPNIPADIPLTCSISKDGDNVLVKLDNGNAGKPWQVSIHILVSPNGTVTYTNATIQLNG